MIYELTFGELREGTMQTFSYFNVVHDVWPRFRQHVFNLVLRGGLPKYGRAIISGDQAVCDYTTGQNSELESLLLSSQ